MGLTGEREGSVGRGRAVTGPNGLSSQFWKWARVILYIQISAAFATVVKSGTCLVFPLY